MSTFTLPPEMSTALQAEIQKLIDSHIKHVPSSTHYKEKEFDGVPYYQTTLGGAWRIKEGFDPRAMLPIDRLMNEVQRRLQLRTRQATLSAINLDNAQLSRVRKGTSNLSAKTILAIYDTTGMSIEEIRSLGALPSFIE